MFGWLARRDTARADRLIAEGHRAEQAGDLARACTLYREAAAITPRYAKAHVNLGIALEAAGDIDGAIAAQEAALAAEAADPYANYNLAKLRYGRGEFAAAEPLLERALRARADFPEALVLRGCAAAARGDAPAALAPLERAARLRPQDFGTLFHYAGVLRALNRLADAKAALARALALEPGNTDARAAFADVLAAQGDTAGAVEALEAVLAQRPDWADALYNYGCMLRKRQRLPDAEAAFRRAIALEPRHARAYQMLGGVLLAQSRIQEARELYGAARRACPEDFGLASAELFSLLADERVSDAELFERHQAFGRELERVHAPPAGRVFRNTREPERRLRIGYVSADFCYHVISLQMLAVLEHHERAGFEVTCYSTTEAPDAYTRQLEELADRWRAWPRLAEADMARAIEADGIDILVDLAGHSGVSQLPLLARRPAPVQATWIGYLATSGLSRIDYRISDPIADPPGLTERHHTESLARLPRCQWCWRPFVSTPHAPEPPCVRNGYPTFGSFHGAMKLSPTVRELWAEILARLPDARFIALGVPAGQAQSALARDLGVAAERVTMVPYVAIADYMRWYESVDVILDTQPYSGANTTCDALFMGAPVITAPGTRSASRSAASVLANVGLADCIAADNRAYVERALSLAADRERLVELRRTLRARLEASPVMDERGFVRDLEQAYRRMWRRWCAGEPPAGW